MTSFLPQEFIRQKRDGKTLDPKEIADFIKGVADGSISEGQAAAFAMAVFFQGLEAEETAALTSAMARSGRMLSWSGLDRPVLDKHSTGGVGDKVSLILAPILAACGAAVPMISGRGLGHTGGTLDKLDSIPGYNSTPGIDLFSKAIEEAHCAIIGQTDDLAPADRRLYAIRDVTATVESIPLITASILSKKLAAGLGALVMDVKAGNGAFMENVSEAAALARSIVTVANTAGLKTSALVTDMNQVLGHTAGNALEVSESLELLSGRSADARLKSVTEALCCELLVMGGLAADETAARTQINSVLESGKAAEAFERMSALLGGPNDLLANSARYLPKAAIERPVFAGSTGYIERIDTRGIGLAVIALGGGRTRADQQIDHSVGIGRIAALGAEIDKEMPLAVVHARNEDEADQAVARVRSCFSIGPSRPAATPLLIERVSDC